MYKKYTAWHVINTDCVNTLFKYLNWTYFISEQNKFSLILLFFLADKHNKK